jgi:hypothetical protein
MDGFEKFLHIFIDHAKKDLTEKDYGNDPEYREVFVNQILGLNGPKQMKRKITPSFTFFSKLYVGFKEIADSYYCLIDIETYIGRFPYGDTRISKTRHLVYHMENYINEVYILKERLTSYFTIIGRCQQLKSPVRQVPHPSNVRARGAGMVRHLHALLGVALRCMLNGNSC